MLLVGSCWQFASHDPPTISPYPNSLMKHSHTPNSPTVAGGVWGHHVDYAALAWVFAVCRHYQTIPGQVVSQVFHNTL